MPRKRTAKLDAVLTFFDRALLVVLNSQQTKVLGIAVPENKIFKEEYLGVTVSQRNWDRYIDGKTDVRFVFNYATPRTLYSFDLPKDGEENEKISMIPLEKEPTEAMLPLLGLFSRHHTEEYESVEEAPGNTILSIDGEWEMTEFGSFQSRYSDVYAFIAGLTASMDPNIGQIFSSRIRQVFRDKPFQGGASYVSFFNDLFDILPSRQRLRLSSIDYASPGTMEVEGIPKVFIEEKEKIVHFLHNDTEIREIHSSLRKFLSRNGYLRMPGSRFPIDTPDAEYIRQQSKKLFEGLGFEGFEALEELSDKNSLVAAKICLALFRRIETLSRYFAEGRMSFS